MSNIFFDRGNRAPNEILRVTSDGQVFMRTHPDGDSPGHLVRVVLTNDEIRRLRNCSEIMEGIAILAGIVARLSRLN